MTCKYCHEDHGCDNPGCDNRSLKAEIDRLRAYLAAIKNLGESHAYDLRDLDMFTIAVNALRPNAQDQRGA